MSTTTSQEHQPHRRRAEAACRALGVLAALLAGVAWGDDNAQRRAQEDIDKQLQQMVGKTPTRVKVDFVSLDDPNYALEEAEFELDGVGLKAPAAAALNGEGTALVWQGDAKPGKHVLAVRLVYANKSSVIVSDEGGFKWKIGGTVSFDLFAGIEVQVKVTPTRVAGQKDINKRFKLALPATPVMVARLDDGRMPDPMKRPELDAGVLVAAVDPKLKPKQEAEAKRLAALEEKKAKAEAARAAKQEANEARAEARRQALEEKRRKAEEAKLAKVEAARLAKEALERKKHPERFVKETADAGPALAEAPDAAVELDAGPPVAVAVAALPDAGLAKPQAAPVGEGGLPWLPIGGGGAALLVVILIVVARRRSSVPKLD